MMTWSDRGYSSRHEHIHGPAPKKDFFDNGSQRGENPQEFEPRDFSLFNEDQRNDFHCVENIGDCSDRGEYPR